MELTEFLQRSGELIVHLLFASVWIFVVNLLATLSRQKNEIVFGIFITLFLSGFVVLLSRFGLPGGAIGRVLLIGLAAFSAFQLGLSGLKKVCLRSLVAISCAFPTIAILQTMLWSDYAMPNLHDVGGHLFYLKGIFEGKSAWAENWNYGGTKIFGEGQLFFYPLGVHAYLGLLLPHNLDLGYALKAGLSISAAAFTLGLLSIKELERFDSRLLKVTCVALGSLMIFFSAPYPSFVISEGSISRVLSFALVSAVILATYGSSLSAKLNFGVGCVSVFAGFSMHPATLFFTVPFFLYRTVHLLKNDFKSAAWGVSILVLAMFFLLPLKVHTTSPALLAEFWEQGIGRKSSMFGVIESILEGSFLEHEQSVVAAQAAAPQKFLLLLLSGLSLIVTRSREGIFFVSVLLLTTFAGASSYWLYPTFSQFYSGLFYLSIGRLCEVGSLCVQLFIGVGLVKAGGALALVKPQQKKIVFVTFFGISSLILTLTLDKISALKERMGWSREYWGTFERPKDQSIFVRSNATLYWAKLGDNSVFPFQKRLELWAANPECIPNVNNDTTHCSEREKVLKKLSDLGEFGKCDFAHSILRLYPYLEAVQFDSSSRHDRLTKCSQR